MGSHFRLSNLFERYGRRVVRGEGYTPPGKPEVRRIARGRRRGSTDRRIGSILPSLMCLARLVEPVSDRARAEALLGASSVPVVPSRPVLAGVMAVSE